MLRASRARVPCPWGTVRLVKAPLLQTKLWSGFTKQAKQGDSGSKPATKPGAKPGPKAGKPKAKGKVLKRPAAKPVEADRGQGMGCLRCRGCRFQYPTCKDENFRGLRLNRGEWLQRAKLHGYK